MTPLMLELLLLATINGLPLTKLFSQSYQQLILIRCVSPSSIKTKSTTRSSFGAIMSRLNFNWAGTRKNLVFSDDNGRRTVSKLNDKVFRLFDQLDSGLEGSGVGLVTAKRIFDIHLGHIWMESASPPERIFDIHLGHIWMESASPPGGRRFCFTRDIH